MLSSHVDIAVRSHKESSIVSRSSMSAISVELPILYYHALSHHIRLRHAISILAIAKPTVRKAP
jgi:hypothetical protein